MIFSGLFGDSSRRTIKKYEAIVAEINGLEQGYSSISAEDLQKKTAYFKQRYADGETLDALMPEAFAAVREAARRTLGQRHYDMQLIGGIILHVGGIAEMKTGEGKTLVATLPAYLNALTGRGVHVVTVNDYLSRRDCVWMGQIYAFLGLSVGVINQDASYIYDPSHTESHTESDAMRDELGSFKVVYDFLRPASKKDAYAADITYGTNNEFGFDYLRDNIAYAQEMLVQREYVYAIVDEIDSILIDEARTPLIISAPAEDAERLYETFARIAQKLQKDEDYTIDEKLRTISLLDSGIEKAEHALGVENIYAEGGTKYVHHLENAIRAKALYLRDKEYVVRDGQVVIVDEFTGRLQPGRRWSEGLHQAIEAKEGVVVEQESRTIASITFQNYFRMYEKLAGMTGTAKTSSEEFYTVYGLDVVEVPPNRPIARRDLNDSIFQTERGKFQAVVARVKELHLRGQPVLIGTASIEKNELLSEFFSAAGIPHQVLNAKNHEHEAEIIAQAGALGKVTIATNMAGRGVDIILGGTPPDKVMQEQVRSLGGLTVIGTERHDARRIDNQLRGRSGRQGDPGETQFYVSLEDSLMRIFASDAIKKLMGRFGIPEDQPIENTMLTRSLETAQTKIEGFNFDARKNVLEYDSVLNHQRRSIYERRRKVLTGGTQAAQEFLAQLAENDPEFESVLREKEAIAGTEAFLAVASRIILQTIDMFWMEHLDQMNYMRSSVNLRAYGQRDPLVEYKREGITLFKIMLSAIDLQIKEMTKGINEIHQHVHEKRGAEMQHIQFSGGSPAAGEGIAGAAPQGVHLVAAKAAAGIPGRNDLCPCGSGKKYKNCGLRGTQEHQERMAQKQGK